MSVPKTGVSISGDDRRQQPGGSNQSSPPSTARGSSPRPPMISMTDTTAQGSRYPATGRNLNAYNPRGPESRKAGSWDQMPSTPSSAQRSGRSQQTVMSTEDRKKEVDDIAALLETISNDRQRAAEQFGADRYKPPDKEK